MDNVHKESSVGPWIAFGRVFFGLMWFYEILLGHNWKWGNPGWMGEGAGTWLIEDAAKAVATGTWPWAAWVFNTVIVPYADMWSYAVTALQLIIAVSLTFGIFVRPIAAAGLFHTAIMFMSGHSRIPPFFLVGFLIILALDAGVHYGLDTLIVRKLARTKSVAGRALLWIITLPVGKYVQSRTLLALAMIAGIFLMFQIAAVESARFRMVSLDLAVIFGIVAVCLAWAKKADITALTARSISIFVGYRFLHEIWIRNIPALNGLPGWATAERLAEPFATVASNHYGPIAWLAGNLIIPYAGVWIWVFGVTQFAVGVMLIIGWRPRQASVIGIGYLVFLVLFGFTRYTPFMLGLLIISYVLGSGAGIFSLDGLRAEGAKAKIPVLSRPLVLLSAMILVLTAVLAASGGIIQGDYREVMGPVTMAMFVILFVPLVGAGIIQSARELKEKKEEKISCS